jgi:hypothetical protein
MSQKDWNAQTVKAADKVKLNVKKAILSEEETAYLNLINQKKNNLNTENIKFQEFSKNLNNNIKEYNNLLETQKSKGLKSMTLEEKTKLSLLRKIDFSKEEEVKEQMMNKLVKLANDFQTSSLVPNTKQLGEDARFSDKADFIQTTLLNADHLIEKINKNSVPDLVEKYAVFQKQNAKPAKSKIVIQPKGAGPQLGSEPVKKPVLKKVVKKEELLQEQKEVGYQKNAVQDELKQYSRANLKKVETVEKQAPLVMPKKQIIKLDDE